MKPRATHLRARWFVLLAAAFLMAATPTLAPAQRANPNNREQARPRGNFEMAQEWLLNRFRRERPAGKYERGHNSVVSAFREVVADPAKSTVEILCNHEPVALGTVVAANGYILTKASDLDGKIACKLHDDRRFEAELAGVNKQHDLALLKIDVDNLTPVVWTDQSDTPVGSWLATPGLAEEPLSIGVISAAARAIAAPRPILGVLLAQSDLGARIDQVMPGSGAEQAKLQIGDIILGCNEEEIKSREALIRRIGQFQPGDTVKLMVRRGEEQLQVDALLGPMSESGEVNRHDFQNQLGGELSRRRAGFPSVFQHDTVLQPNECGGPVVDLNGHAVGVNIARAGRVASYAIPTSIVKDVLAQLMHVKPVSLQESAGQKMH